MRSAWLFRPLWGRGSSRWAAFPGSLWLQAGLIGCLFGGLFGGAGSSCAVADPEYCATSAHCPMVDGANGPEPLVCNTFRHVCVPGACFSDSDCKDFAAPHCDRETATCTSCRADDPFDTSCEHFIDRNQCIAKKDGVGTICAACQSSTECPQTEPICDNYQCRKCTAHSDCEGELTCDGKTPCTNSMVCIMDNEASPTEDKIGRCAVNGTGGQVIYINNQVACSDFNLGNLPTMPLCSLDAGLMMAATQHSRYIRVLGQGLPPPNSAITQGSYTIIGAPTRATTELATVEGRGVLFNVKDSGVLTLDQLHLVEKQDNTTLVQCLGIGSILPRLTLRNSVLTGATSATATQVSAGAVSVANCNTILDGNTIGVSTMAALGDPQALVHGAAILIGDTANNRGSSYLIQNNLIAGNAGFAINLLGVSSDSAQVVMRFNTIVRNGRATPGNGAVACPLSSSMMELSHSIILDNSLFTGGSQFLFPQNCGFKDLVVGTNETATDPMFKRVPELDPQFRLQASAANRDCCIDKVSPAAGETLPATDIDRKPRPQGGKWDIGAAELTP